MPQLAALTEEGDEHIAVEMPRGSRAKFVLERTGNIISRKSLLTRLNYPHDWDFVPSIRAGCPLRVIVIHDAATLLGIGRIIGILPEQKRKARAEQNDRLFAVLRCRFSKRLRIPSRQE
jgi:inorganic pyrophosphatase